MRPAPARRAALDSGDEDLQPLSRLRSQSGRGCALRGDTGKGTGDARSRRSSRRLSAAQDGKSARGSDDDSGEELEGPAPARRQSLRSSHAAAAQTVQSPTQEHASIDSLTGRSRRAASHSIKAVSTGGETQPKRLLRTRDTRAATRAKTAAPQHKSSSEESGDEDSIAEPLQLRSSTRAATKAKAAVLQRKTSPEESSDEESEPEPLQQKNVTATRQKRKASKLVQGGGGLSDDDDSASGETLHQLHRSMLSTGACCP